jgi:hypothetical protein
MISGGLSASSRKTAFWRRRWRRSLERIEASDSSPYLNRG